ncbi:hypothetical protein NKR23_g12101 [Pleurostoma richardsiae]|uniref:Uncharacterized protein n=1 Tax=Pleurostoma richardsiae TaxID=41990 RepID=A0AA38R1Z4_9PEZI|nr:hypothetical protein NKR23_g12101 [Pleurostoma richardsiae]
MDQTGLKVIFYDPNRAAPSREEYWEYIVNRIFHGLSRDRGTLSAPFLRSLSWLESEEPIESAARLARSISSDKGEVRAFKELLLYTLCATLQRRGLNSRGDKNWVLRIVAGDVGNKTLGAFTRGAVFANEVIFEWAARSGHQDGIALATSAIYTGGLTIPQWAVLADHKKDAKERIVSSSLPSNSLGESPLLIPCLIEAMTGGRVMSADVCQFLDLEPSLLPDPGPVVQAYRAVVVDEPA